jgi:hypothetical protein
MKEIIYSLSAKCEVTEREVTEKFMTESEWTRGICSALRARNAMVFPIVASKYQPAGWPDRLIIHKYGGTVLLEFKGHATPVSVVQKHVIANLRERGASAFIVRIDEDGFGFEIDGRKCRANSFPELAGALLTILKELRNEEL